MDDEKVLITESTLDNIADATREKNGESFKYYPSEIPAAIRRIPTGQGGGSVVAVFPILLSGTHIADIVVDGDTFALYAPTPKVYTEGTGIEISQNGVVSVSQALRTTINGKVDNDTFTTAINSLTASVASKQDLLTEGDGISIQNNVISADMDVSDISDVNLSSLADGQVLKWNATSQKWENATESGGTTVVANPSGTPTDQLNTIQIGEDIYEIVGGGQGGGGYSETDLWSGAGNMFTSLSITLDDDYTKYDALKFEYQSVRADGQTVPVHYERLVSKETIETTDRFSISDFYLWNNVGVNVSGTFTDSTHLTTYLEAYSWFASCTLTRIVGIKYGSGGGGGQSGDVETLFTSSSFVSTINLTKDLFNYDLITFEVSDGNGYTRGISFAPSELSVNQIVGFDNNYGYIWNSITSGTVLTNVSQSNFFIASIVGMKIGAGGSSLPFDMVIDSNDNGINLVYDDGN